MNTRYLATEVIQKVLEGQSLNDCLEPALIKVADSRDKAFIQALCYGVCRYYARLDFVLRVLMDKPLKPKDLDVEALLLVGLYQLMEMRVPEHAAVTETVNVIRQLNKKTWARGLVNAVLRNYLRQQSMLEKKIKANEEANFAHPAWWVKALKQAYPAKYQDILIANNQHPPFCLRVNRKHSSRNDYLQKLAAADMNASEIKETKHGICLEAATSVEALPGFKEGDVSVQDGAAQLAAEWLDLEAGQHVLDACAAPGGKLTHILESVDKVSVVAVEKEAARCDLIKQNLKRLVLNAECICDDVINVSAWWDKKPFDRILLDAPCSASGIIRRHPDIKLLREPGDIAQLANLQGQLLEALWPTLKPGGVLLYATCSVFPEENSQVISQFLKNHQDAELQALPLKGAETCKIGVQLLPGMYGLDGFYYAKLCKQAAESSPTL